MCWCLMYMSETVVYREQIIECGDETCKWQANGYCIKSWIIVDKCRTYQLEEQSRYVFEIDKGKIKRYKEDDKGES